MDYIFFNVLFLNFYNLYNFLKLLVKIHQFSFDIVFVSNKLIYFLEVSESKISYVNIFFLSKYLSKSIVFIL